MWRAEVADEAPEDDGGMDCERALDKSGEGSVFDIGQRYLTRDLRGSLEFDWTAAGPGGAETAVAVDLRWKPERGGRV